MPRQRVFNFHDDERHGWLEVKFTTLRNHGWRPESFTEYSYVDEAKGVAYLEQDIDAVTLLRWYDERGMKWALRENIWPGLAPIRNLLPLDPNWPAWPDFWLPASEEHARKVAEYEAKYGDERYESRRANAALYRRLYELRRQAGQPEVQGRDRRLMHEPPPNT